MPLPRDQQIERFLLSDQAYAVLRSAIIDGTLAPGERLRDAELVLRLGLSRTPIREALARLQEDGLVESEPNRYTRVAPLDRRDARDAYPIVAGLHALAAELGVRHLTPDEIRTMRMQNQRFATAIGDVDVDEAMAADDAFHGVLIDASGNPAIGATLERLMPRLHRLERVQFGSLLGRRSVSQHEAIIAASQKGDAQGAADAVRENWLSLGALIEKTFRSEET
jgi:DNA-binding GntR family transcriptional regulator